MWANFTQPLLLLLLLLLEVFPAGLFNTYLQSDTFDRLINVYKNNYKRNLM